MHRCGHNADVYIRCIMCIGALVTKYVFIVHCVVLSTSICMCILHIVFSTVCKYVLSICKLLCFGVLVFLFLHCLEHAHKNFTHQGTCAVLM